MPEVEEIIELLLFQFQSLVLVLHKTTLASQGRCKFFVLK